MCPLHHLPLGHLANFGFQVVVGCAADLPAGILQFSTNGAWVAPTFTGVQCAGTPVLSGGFIGMKKTSLETIQMFEHRNVNCVCLWMCKCSGVQVRCDITCRILQIVSIGFTTYSSQRYRAPKKFFFALCLPPCYHVGICWLQILFVLKRKTQKPIRLRLLDGLRHPFILLFLGRWRRPSRFCRRSCLLRLPGLLAPD